MDDDDLAAFLRARLDEDEAAARAAADGPWTSSGPYVDAPGAGIIMQARHTEDAAHAARHDPARVLREVEAKRAILAQWQAQPPDSPVLTNALYQLAAVYSDHPGYRPEWKP